MSLTVAPETIEFFSQIKIGVVEQTITLHQRGRVRCMATTWFAQFYQPTDRRSALPGTFVKVIGREGLTLLVMPLEAVGSESQGRMVDRPQARPSKRSGWMQQMGTLFATWLT